MKKLILVVLLFLASQTVYGSTLFRDSTIISTDDAVDFGGTWYITGSDISKYIDIGNGGEPPNYYNNAGMRFQNVTIPKGSIIDSAFLYVRSDADYTNNNTYILVYCEDTSNATTFSTRTDFYNRIKTTNSATWNILTGEPWYYEATYYSANIKNPIQEVISRSDWSSGNALGVFIYDNGSAYGNSRGMFAWDYDGPSVSPKILIYWSPGDTTAPDSVKNVVCSETTAVSVILKCKKNDSTDCGGYMVRYATGATSPATYADGTFGDSTSLKADTVFGISGLNPATQYSFSIFARDEIPNWSVKGPTSSVTVTTDGDAYPPDTVRNIAATSITATVVSLACHTNDSTDCGGYMVRYAGGSTPPATYSAGTFGDSTSSRTDTTFQITGLIDDSTYSFAIFARDIVPNWSILGDSAQSWLTVKSDTFATAQPQIIFDVAYYGGIYEPTDSIPLTVSLNNIENADSVWMLWGRVQGNSFSVVDSLKLTSPTRTGIYIKKIKASCWAGDSVGNMMGIFKTFQEDRLGQKTWTWTTKRDTSSILLTSIATSVNHTLSIQQDSSLNLSELDSLINVYILTVRAKTDNLPSDPASQSILLSEIDGLNGWNPATTAIIPRATNAAGDTLARQKDSTAFQAKGFSTHSAANVKSLFGDTLSQMLLTIDSLLFASGYDPDTSLLTFLRYIRYNQADYKATGFSVFDPATTPVTAEDTNASGDTLARLKDSLSFQGSGAGVESTTVYGAATQALTDYTASTFNAATTPVVPSDTNVSGDTLARQKDSTSFQGAGGATASQIWGYETRGLTEIVVASETTEAGKHIATQESLGVLATTLEGYYIDLDDDSSGGGGATAQEVWEYAGEKEIDTVGYLKAGAGAGASAHEVAESLDARGWMIGSGNNLCSLWVFTADDTTAVMSVPVYVKNSGLTATVAQNLTSSVGAAPFKLSNATYKIFLNSPAYPQVNTYDTFTVSGASQDTVWVNKFDPGNPPAADLCRAYNWVYKTSGVPDSGAIIEMKIKKSPLRYQGIIISPYAVKDTADGNGYFFLDVYPNTLLTPATTKYQIKIYHTDGTIFSDTLAVPDSASWKIAW